MSYLGLLPVSLVLLAAVTFGISYTIAVIRGDVRAAFPYISDTGSERPESCIFGQFLNLAAFLAFWTMYIRYKAVQAMAMGNTEDRKLGRLNKISLALGLISALGVSVVANFQEGTIVEAVHVVGAGVTFIAGVFYCFVQAGLSYHMYPEYNGIFICRMRLIIGFVAFISLIVTITAAGFALHEWNEKGHHSESKFKWAPSDPGYDAHIVSTVGEWVTALVFLGFFFTYVREFDKFELEIHTRPLVRHLDERLPQPLSHQRVDDVEVNERTKLLS